MRISKISLTVLWLALAASCVVSPTDQQRIKPSDPLALSGYASIAGTTLRVQAKNQRTGAWDVVATFTATTTPTTIAGDTLYAWNGSLIFTQVNTADPWRCYFSIPGSNPCQVPEPAANAQIRVLQGDGSVLTTFDDGGLTCVIGKLNEGKTWLTAGYECRDNNSPVINLRWVL